ncbi:MAG TPA: hypothetical protein VFC00_15770 [Micromonosporaceae bacterium]|nr:hypothetical protein [Micromonosporaceae bacterium]
MIVAATVLLASGCSASPASKQEVCDSFDALGVQMLRANGIVDNPIFRAAESLADTADRYEGGGLSADAKRLHEISDSDATSVAELMGATTSIADLCGHPLGIGSTR